MKFKKAEVELIVFDNSDVIITSPGDLDCNSLRDAYAYCTQQGDSTLPNECGNLSGRICFISSRIDPFICDASGNQVFVNSPGPNDPVDM